jgi:hypothetical protein
MSHFEAKDGLFEFTKKRLAADDRENAFRRAQAQVNIEGSDLALFLSRGSGVSSAKDTKTNEE